MFIIRDAKSSVITDHNPVFTVFSFLKLSNLRVDHVIFRFSEKSQHRRYCKKIT
uniref:Uncharacterized protein n=1 Tax=Rhizophagus irregularis (strain DAOM 181602 / DAOM 197198 / MUCL 43194) TaxID=747089 RepID=U9UKN0_RHIID